MARTLIKATLMAATLLGAALVQGCAPVRDSYAARPADVYGTVTGQVVMLTRQALPEEAVIEVAILDDSNADPAPGILGNTLIEGQGPMPFPFNLTYRRDSLIPGHTYRVEATMAENGRVLYLAELPVTVSATPGPELSVGDLILRPAPPKPKSN